MTLLRAVMAASLALVAGCSSARENAAGAASDASGSDALAEPDSAASDGSTTDGPIADADCSVWHFVISGLADGFVEVLASKPGFNVLASPKDDSIQLTGRVPVKTGFVSHLSMLILGAGDGG